MAPLKSVSCIETLWQKNFTFTFYFETNIWCQWCRQVLNPPILHVYTEWSRALNPLTTAAAPSWDKGNVRLHCKEIVYETRNFLCGSMQCSNNKMNSFLEMKEEVWKVWRTRFLEEIRTKIKFPWWLPESDGFIKGFDGEYINGWIIQL